MSISTVRAAIKSKLDSLSTVSRTLDYVYWTDDWSNIYTKFSVGGRINVWQIGWANSLDNSLDAGNITRNYTINLLGMYSIKTSDESSKAFEDIIEDVMNEFSESKSFLASTTHTSPQLITVENGVYVNTPVHRAQIQFIVTEIIAQDLICISS